MVSRPPRPLRARPVRRAGRAELVVREIGQRPVIAGVEADLEARLRELAGPATASGGKPAGPRRRAARAPAPTAARTDAAIARRRRQGRRAAARPRPAGPPREAPGAGSRPRSAAACRRCHQKPCGASRPAPVRKNAAGQPRLAQQRRRNLHMAREVVVEGDRDRDPSAAPAREHRAVQLRRRHEPVRASQVTQMPSRVAPVRPGTTCSADGGPPPAISWDRARCSNDSRAPAMDRRASAARCSARTPAPPRTPPSW